MAMVCHMDKCKTGDLNGLRKEDDRSCDAINKKNPDLDLTRTPKNYTICQNRVTGELNYIHQFKCGKTLRWDESIKRRVRALEKRNIKRGGKRFRKDAVVCGSWVLGADKEFMDGLSLSDQKKYFTMMYNYLGGVFGSNNIASFTVHMDEGSVGAHCRIMPITKDGRLCAKEVFNPTTLAQVQREMYEYLHAEFPSLIQPDFGNSKRKHLDEMTFKFQQEKKKLDDLRGQIADLGANKEFLENSIAKLQKTLNEANTDIARLHKEIAFMEKQKETMSAHLDSAENDLRNIISLRNELFDFMKDQANKLGIPFKKTTEGYILDIKNGTEKIRAKLAKTPKVPTQTKKYNQDR